MLLLYHRLYVSTVYIAVVYVAVYVLVQLEEGYSLIWKAKPLAIQNDKSKCLKKIDKKGKNWLSNGLLCLYFSLDDVIYHQFYILNISITLKIWSWSVLILHDPFQGTVEILWNYSKLEKKNVSLWVTNWKLYNKTLHLGLLTQSWKIKNITSNSNSKNEKRILLLNYSHLGLLCWNIIQVIIIWKEY